MQYGFAELRFMVKLYRSTGPRIAYMGQRLRSLNEVARRNFRCRSVRLYHRTIAKDIGVNDNTSSIWGERGAGP